MSIDLHLLRRLRPSLSPRFQCLQSYRPARAFVASPTIHRDVKRPHLPDVTHDYEKRVAQLNQYISKEHWYPRLAQGVASKDIGASTLRSRYGHLEPGETSDECEYVIAGRIRSIRSAGSKLVFIDVEPSRLAQSHPVVEEDAEPVGDLDGSTAVQSVFMFTHLQQLIPDLEIGQFRSLSKIARKGDSFLISGHAHRTSSGQLSIRANRLPTLLAPSLHQIPETLEDATTRAQQPHVDMRVNPSAIQSLKVRHLVERTLSNFLDDRDFTRVNTPILGAAASGATARPFETRATELSEHSLSLRIAPELWLKRLVVGGLECVYEIGPAFRNEGVDATHNPEFSICEFYQAYATLEDLLVMTQDLLAAMSGAVAAARERGGLTALTSCSIDFHAPIARVEFIPGLESHLGQKLPDLSSQPEAIATLLEVFAAKDVPLPSSPHTLPRLLDALAAHYLEPASHDAPLFITHHPACLSPLAKHFRCPQTGQIVAARAELFIAGRECANMYEEENSPFAQAEKFAAQSRLRDGGETGTGDDEAMRGDEGFIRALEWGLPPTGGWGCGIDRLVMLFSGQQRIADVLPFGSLRNVVALGTVGRASTETVPSARKSPQTKSGEKVEEDQL